MQEIVNNYFDWLKENTTVQKSSYGYVIDMPFLDRINDYISIDCTNCSSDSKKITLEFDHYNIYRKKDLHQMEEIAKKYNVKFYAKDIQSSARRDEDVFFINLESQVETENFNEKFHNFLQAVVLISNSPLHK